MASVQYVWCVGSARFVKEISPLIDSQSHVKWIADAAALVRNLTVASEFVAAIVDHTDNVALTNLQLIRSKFPRTRRLVIVDACDLKTLRDYLDTEAATEIVYRPLERIALLRSCGLPVTPAARIATPSRASLHA